MKISAVAPLGLQNNKGSSKIIMPAFGQESLSDSEKLTKTLEALSDIGSALKRLGEKTQETAAALRGTKNVPVTEQTDKNVDMEEKIISMSPAINKMAHNIKYEYIAGNAILKEANAIIKEYNSADISDGKFSILGYPYKVCEKDDGVHITSDFNAGVDDYGIPTTPRGLEIIYKDNEYDTGLQFTAKSERYTITPYTEDGSFNITKILHDNTKETYDFYNDGNIFEYKKTDTETNKVITSLSKYINNTVTYMDNKKEPDGIALKINKYSDAVQYKKLNPAEGEENEFKTAYVDSETVDLLLDITSDIYGK